MKVKSVPEPPDTIDGLREVHASFPVISDDREALIREVRANRSIPSDRANTVAWLLLLRAMGLVDRSVSTGTYQRRPFPDNVNRLGSSFLEGVFQADEIFAQLRSTCGRPITARAVLEAGIRPTRWEGLRIQDAEAAWEARIQRILDWFVLLGLADRRTGGYRVLEG